MFDGDAYQVTQRISIGNKYVISEEGRDVLESAQKKFRLKEDFRFTDADTGEEAFRVTADSVLDIASAYDIVDVRTDERVGAVRRTVKSFLKHEYELLGPDGTVVATMAEDNWVNAFLRRNVIGLLPHAYTVSQDGRELATVSGHLSLRDRYDIRVTGDIDPRLVVIATVVVDAIEAN